MEHHPLDTIREKVAHIQDVNALRELRDQVHGELQDHPLFLYPAEWSRQINELLDVWIIRALELAEESLVKEGLGQPPIPYGFLLFGSGGRREQTLWSDQDNGMVLAELPEGRETETLEYFRLLSERIVDALCRLGFPRCEGNVICTNPMWRKPLSEWKQMQESWFVEPNWEHVRYMLVQADMRLLRGDVSLARELKSYFLEGVARRRSLLQDMLRNTLHRKVSLGLLGHLIPERYGEEAGGYEIKYGAYIPIVNGVRLLAIQQGIEESETMERLQRLKQMGILSEEQWKDWHDAFVRIVELRSLASSRLDHDGTWTSRGIIPASLMTKERKQELKFGLQEGMKLQRFVRRTVRQEDEHGRERGKQ